jgi:hypothetical protein
MAAVIRGATEAAAGSSPRAEPRRASDGGDSSGAASPAELARSLFPGDEARGREAEAALRAGRVEEFRRLLRRAGEDLGRRLTRAAEPERRKLLEEGRRIAAMEEGLGGESREGSGGFERLPEGEAGRGGEAEGGPEAGREEEASREGDPGASPRRGLGQGDESPSASPGKGRGEGGAGQPGTERDSGAGPGGDIRPGGGLLPGEGPGRARDWGPVTPRAAGPEAAIAPDPEAPFFAFVLPGADPSGAEAEALAAPGRSAESALRREPLPLEYEGLLRSYFLELAKSASDASGGGAEGSDR